VEALWSAAVIGFGNELGHFCLWLALAVALLQAIVPLIGAQRGDGRLTALAPAASYLQLLLVLASFALLMRAFLRSDFSLLLVYNHSHTQKPLLYKITGLWANHEGSLLLWMLILSLCSAAVAGFGRRLPKDFRARVLSIMAMISVGFLSFLLLTSNPFARLSPVPADGVGLNPILQDPGLAFHPPLLYVGYVGLSVSFAFAVAALIEGRIGPMWAKWVRPWTLFAWIFLTIGIALGSWWAYYELGWGGYWFWDPVENAALMPWLAATALLHSAIVLEKRDALKSWTVLLAIIAFSLSLMGTFIVRSGVLTSVHAFAVDPARGIFILGFLSLVIGGALSLYAWRASSLESGAAFASISREGFLVANNLLLAACLLTVFLGTLYPLMLEAFGAGQISVGPPYYKATFAPIASLLCVMMAIGPMLRWRRDSWAQLKPAVLLTAFIMLAGVVLAVMLGGATSWLGVCGFALCFWIFGGIVADFAHKLRFGAGGVRSTAQRLRRLPSANWAVAIGHLGMAVVVFGITASGAWHKEALLSLRVGQTVPVGPYRFELRDIEPVAGPNYTALQGYFVVSKAGRVITSLYPQARSYANPVMETTEAAIAPRITGDLYAVLGKPNGDGSWQIRLHWKPFMSWLWIGCLIMALGGIIAMADRRLRVAA
jgi:cytochrome c-type biogenesis protein CcmF